MQFFIKKCYNNILLYIFCDKLRRGSIPFEGHPVHAIFYRVLCTQRLTVHQTLFWKLKLHAQSNNCAYTCTVVPSSDTIS